MQQRGEEVNNDAAEADFQEYKVGAWLKSYN